jgi:hypothetical protein
MKRARRRAAGLALLAALYALLSGTLASCAGEAPCRYNSDCLHAYCSAGTCKVDCVDATLDCPSGYLCNQVAQCQAPGPGVDGGGADAGVDSSAPDGAQPDTSTVAPDAAVDAAADAMGDSTLPVDAGTPDTSTPPDVATGADGSAGHKVVFDLCASDAECTPGLLCRPPNVGGAPRCTRPCTSTSQCMESTRCVAVGSEQYCVLSDVGLACTASSTCNFGCLLGPKYCTMPCASGSDCPNGYGCEPVGTPPQSVCVKAEAPCSASDTSACIAAAACDTSATLLVGGCTLACNSAADCPQRAQGYTPWTCDGLCRRPPDVYGPLGQGVNPAQYACNASSTVVNLCEDAQHIDFTQFTIPAAPTVNCSATTTTAGVAGDACVDSCLYQGACAFGYACVAVGSVGGARVGLCLPSLGGGEVGAACTNSSQCYFGDCDLTTGTCTRDCSADGLCPTGSTCTVSGTILVQGIPFKRCQ